VALTGVPVIMSIIAGPAPSPAPAPASAAASPAQLLVTVIGVVVGMIVGLGAPWLTAALTRRASLGREQHAVADQILKMWQRPEDLRALLRDDTYGTRRELLLLGSRLQDETARKRCLMLVHSSAQPDYSEDRMIDDWSDLVVAVSQVYRKTGG